MYRRKRFYKEQYDISMRTVSRKVEWILAHADRYPKDSVVKNGKFTFIREDVFEDVIVNQNRIDAGMNPEFKEAEHA